MSMNSVLRRSYIILLALIIIGFAITLDFRSWRDVAAEDLRFVYETIKEAHPGVIDSENPSFVTGWMEEGYKKALNMLDEVDSREAHRALLQYYLAGFNDRHVILVGMRGRSKSFEWPGFVAEFRDGAYYVRAPHGPSLPPDGARILKIGELTPEERMREILQFKVSQDGDRGSWIAHSPDLLIDDGNPWISKPTSILLEAGLFSLLWRKHQSNDGFYALAENSNFSPPLETGVYPFGENGLWIAVGDFYPENEKERARLEAVVQKLEEGYRYDLIVFDLRGNLGGNLEWGLDMLTALYGRKIGVPWGGKKRVSPQRKAFLEMAIKEFGEVYGKDYRIIPLLEKEKEQLKLARKRGQKWYGRHQPKQWIGEQIKGHPGFYGRIYVVSDWGVTSSGRRLVDILRRLPSVQHVGMSFGLEESPYTEPVGLNLPSGLYQFKVPTKVNIGLLKGPHEPYDPDILFPGDIQDTHALQKWILKLEKER